MKVLLHMHMYSERKGVAAQALNLALLVVNTMIVAVVLVQKVEE